MGKGDRKTRRGKLFGGSYGVLRPRKRKRTFSVVSTTKKTIAETEKPKAAPKPKATPKPKAEPVAEEPKTVAAEAVPEAEEVKAEVEEVKAETEEVKAEAKPAAKKPAAVPPGRGEAGLRAPPAGEPAPAGGDRRQQPRDYAAGKRAG